MSEFDLTEYIGRSNYITFPIYNAVNPIIKLINNLLNDRSFVQEHTTKERDLLLIQKLKTTIEDFNRCVTITDSPIAEFEKLMNNIQQVLYGVYPEAIMTKTASYSNTRIDRVKEDAKDIILKSSLKYAIDPSNEVIEFGLSDNVDTKETVSSYLLSLSVQALKQAVYKNKEFLAVIGAPLRNEISDINGYMCNLYNWEKNNFSFLEERQIEQQINDGALTHKFIRSALINITRYMKYIDGNYDKYCELILPLAIQNLKDLFDKEGIEYNENVIPSLSSLIQSLGKAKSSVADNKLNTSSIFSKN